MIHRQFFKSQKQQLQCSVLRVGWIWRWVGLRAITHGTFHTINRAGDTEEFINRSTCMVSVITRHCLSSIISARWSFSVDVHLFVQFAITARRSFIDTTPQSPSPSRSNGWRIRAASASTTYTIIFLFGRRDDRLDREMVSVADQSEEGAGASYGLQWFFSL